MSETTAQKVARLQREAAEAQAEATREEQERLDAAIDIAARHLTDNSDMTLEQARESIAGRFAKTPPETPPETVPPVPPVTPPETPPADTPPAETPPAETPPAETPPAETPPADTPPPPPGPEVTPEHGHWSQRKVPMPFRRKEQV